MSPAARADPAQDPGFSVALGDVLDALHEPSALVRPDGAIVICNRRFAATLGEPPQGRDLASFTENDAHEVRRYLVRCCSSREPMVGAFRFKDSNGERVMCRGSRIEVPGEVLVLLRLYHPDERFARLTSTVAELNQLLRQREHEKAKLQEALAERDLLHRELQHRVKNNMQMLSGMLHAAMQESESEQAREALQEAFNRFAAVAAVYQDLYHSDLGSVSARGLIERVSNGALQGSSRTVKLDLNVESFDLPNDVAAPLALIVNELVTNSIKHARPSSGGLKVSVLLSRENGSVHLEVSDNGASFDAPTAWKRASGLGLVKGLVRQLRGKVTLGHEAGVRFTIQFPLPKATPLGGRP